MVNDYNSAISREIVKFLVEIFVAPIFHIQVFMLPPVKVSGHAIRYQCFQLLW